MKALMYVNGFEYSVTSLNGITYINGMPFDEFLEMMSLEEANDLIRLAVKAINDSQNDIETDYQNFLDELYMSRYN